MIMGHRINASDVEISVVPTRINEAITRLDFQVYANNAEVTGQLLSKSYNDLEITSAYGIYDHITDKMTIHMPLVLHYSTWCNNSTNGTNAGPSLTKQASYIVVDRTYAKGDEP